MSETLVTDGIITRSSSRIRMEALKFEGDTLPPQRYDKASKTVKPNEEFLKRNGTRAKNFFKESELVQHGYQKLATTITKEKAQIHREVDKIKYDIVFGGDNSVDKRKKIRSLLNS